jgi:hypothetical protein
MYAYCVPIELVQGMVKDKKKYMRSCGKRASSFLLASELQCEFFGHDIPKRWPRGRNGDFHGKLTTLSSAAGARPSKFIERADGSEKL